MVKFIGGEQLSKKLSLYLISSPLACMVQEANGFTHHHQS